MNIDKRVLAEAVHVIMRVVTRNDQLSNRSSELTTHIPSTPRNIKLLRIRIPRRILMPLILHQIRNIRRILPPIHILYKRQRRIDPGADPRRRPHVPIHNPPCLRDPGDVRAVRDRARPRGLVRRRPAPVEYPRACGDRGASADADEVPQLRVRGAHVGDGGVEVGRARPEAAWDHEHLDIGRGGGEGVRREDFGELCVFEVVSKQSLTIPPSRFWASEGEVPLERGG